MISLRAKHDFAQAIDRRLRSIRGRVRGLATRFVLGKSTRAADDLARVRGETYSGDASDSDELMQHYGFASMPVNGAEGVRISVFSDGDHGVIVALDDRRYRPTLADGETAQYHKDGAIVHMKADGSIVVVPSGTGLVHLGADPAAKAVARATDPLTAPAAAPPGGGLAVWALAVEAALVAAGSPIAPAANYATVLGAVPGALGTITSGATKVKAT